MSGNRMMQWLRRLQPRRFLTQISLLTSLIVFLGMTALSLFNTAEILEQQHRDLESQLDAIASNLAYGAAPHMLVRDVAAAEQLLLRAAEYPGVRAIALVNHSRRVLSEVRRAPDSKPEAVYYYETLQPPATVATQFSWRYGPRAEGHPLLLGLDATHLYIWHPVERGELGWIRVETSADHLRTAAWLRIRDSLLLALVIISLSGLALYWLLRSRLHALSRATDFARNLASTRGEQFPVYTGTRELEQLGHALNDTSNRLHEQESRITRTSALLTNVLDAASEVSIIATDPDGIITVFNRGAERLLGYRADELVGLQSPAAFHLASEVEARGQELSLAAGQPVQGFRVFVHVPEQKGAELREWTYVRKNGTHVPVTLVVTTMREPGTGVITGYLGIAEDITERKRVDRMKSEFVSTVSHELRTPLTSISGALGLIAGGAVGTLPPAAQDMISIAHKNSERLTRLVNDLLDMEKLSAGKMHFDLQTQNLGPLIEQALEANRAAGLQRHITLQLVDRAPEAVVRVDSHRLLQVLSNLLSNAIKYAPDHSSVDVSLEPRESTVRVTVADTGPGIPEEFHARIFQKFSQADSSDTRQKGGTGLGLAISRELVERMGGKIDFTSAPGHGTRFFFDLPLWRTPVAEPVSANDPRAPLILVVEDEPDIAHLLSLMLTRAGYAVDIVATTAQALQALQAISYAAMTLDLMLPDRSGLDLIRILRQQPQTAELPIIVVSAKMEDGRLVFSGDTTSIEWLAKPIDERQLLAAVNRQLVNSDKPLQVLHIEDDGELHRVVRAMTDDSLRFTHASSLAEARKHIAHGNFDVVLLDLGLPDGSGWSLLPELRTRLPRARVVILTGHDTTPEEARTVEAVLMKSRISAETLISAIQARVRS